MYNTVVPVAEWLMWLILLNALNSNLTSNVELICVLLKASQKIIEATGIDTIQLRYQALNG